MMTLCIKSASPWEPAAALQPRSQDAPLPPAKPPRIQNVVQPFFASFFSTFLRVLPTFLTAFFTADAERPVFLAS